MATNTAGTAARDLGVQAVHYLRRGFTLADRGTTIVVGIVPAGSVIIFPMSGVLVQVLFNAGTNNRLDIGESDDSGTNNLGTLLALGTVGFIPLDEGAVYGGRVGTSDKTISAFVDVTGTTPTTGDAEIVICYVPDNDR